MDITSCFCVAAAALFVLTVLWRLKQGGGVGWWPLWGPLGAALWLLVPPAVCGASLLAFSLVLVWFCERRVELQSRAVLITGCDSGFGLALASRLSEAGLQVFAGVLDVNGDGAQRLRRRGSEKLQVLQLDVTDDDQIEAAHRYICSQVEDTGLWGLVNNAGVLRCPMDAELQPLEEYRLCMNVNFLSAVKVCQVFLPLLRRSRGRIVNMSSLAAQVPMPTFAAYGASKAALSVFSEVMRLELSQWGVKVSIVQPASFRTNIFGNSDDVARYRDQILAAVSREAREDYGDAYISSVPVSLSRMSQQASEDLSPVVDDVCHALLSVRPKPLYTPGQMGWLLPFLHRYGPTAVSNAVITAVITAFTRGSARRPAGLCSS